MTIMEAIDARRSRRKYLETPVAKDAAEKLDALAWEYSEASGTRMEFVWNDGGAFNGLRKSYGMFTGVTNYAGLIAEKDNAILAEKMGYYGELLMLRAVSLGLGTCWVGGSFDKKSCPFKLAAGEAIYCTITVGNVAEQDSLKERLIRGITHRKTKTVEEMYKSDAPVPDWFMSGMRAVERAPSAINRQPVMFTYEDGHVFAGVKDTADISMALDLGIAKQHFELGAGRGKWGFGNNAEFIYE